MMKLGQSKKNRVKVKVTGNNFLFTARKIVVRKDEDLDILCLDLDFDGYFLTIVRVWPENRSSRLPKPNISLDSSYTSLDSGFDQAP